MKKNFEHYKTNNNLFGDFGINTNKSKVIKKNPNDVSGFINVNK